MKNCPQCFFSYFCFVLGLARVSEKHPLTVFLSYSVSVFRGQSNTIKNSMLKEMKYNHSYLPWNCNLGKICFFYYFLNVMSKCHWLAFGVFNPLSANPHKMVKHSQAIRRLLPTNCLSVFDHFVGLASKGLMLTLNRFNTLFWSFHCWLWTSKCRIGSIPIQDKTIKAITRILS